MEAVILKDRITGSYSDEEFFQFCAENRDLKIERNNKLEVIIMSPTNSFSGKINAEVLRQLSNWNMERKTGEVFDSSTGFTLPDRSVFSPDAAWVSSSSWSALTVKQQHAFAPVCPEFVAEIRSVSDHIGELKEKSRLWIRNGARLVWLIDPIDKITIIFRKDGMEEVINGFDKTINGEEPIEGFALNLSLLKL